LAHSAARPCRQHRPRGPAPACWARSRCPNNVTGPLLLWQQQQMPAHVVSSAPAACRNGAERRERANADALSAASARPRRSRPSWRLGTPSLL